jgi:two-component system, NarL family, sensor kinase
MRFGVQAVQGLGRAGIIGRRGVAAPRAVALACVVVLAALTSDQADWQPVTLVVALGVTMIVADVLAVTARRIRVSAGLMVQVVAMALLGPAPAAAIGIVAAIPDAAINRVRPVSALNNMALFGFLGLVGGLMFDVAGAAVGLDRDDAAYALLVLPISVLIMALNLALLAAPSPELDSDARRRLLRETGIPTLPYELMNALMATATVFVYAHAGLAAVAALLLVLVITVPLLRTVGTALTHRDDLAALRHVFDERAAEVARLASDRDRLLTEVIDAEERERTRLAESLHDGPVQRLVAIRQDAAEGTSPSQIAENVDAALAETRAIISAFHPVAVQQRGFEASLRAAIAPFPAARTVVLTVDNPAGDDDPALALPLRLAQELTVNAVKHARPDRIDVLLMRESDRFVLEVNDDGVGIDTAETTRGVQAGHVGLAMVRRRVEDAGGRFVIETRRDGGTRSRVVLPARLG